MLHIKYSMISPLRSIWHTLDAYYDDRKNSQVERGRRKVCSTTGFATHLLCSHIKTTCLIFPPLKGKFCNICLFFSYRKNVPMKETVSKTSQALENKSSIQMFVRLLQANKQIPITEEIISWSILKKTRAVIQRGKCTGEGWTSPEHSREDSDTIWHWAASQVAHRIISSA